MDYDYISKQAKSTIFLCLRLFDLPKTFLKMPPGAHRRSRVLKIGFLVDNFQLHIDKLTENRLRISLFRICQDPEAEPDDGYILKFHLMILGFEEEAQIVFMDHEENQVSCIFGLSKVTQAKLNSVYPHSFDVLALVEMLEIKCLDETNSFKKEVNVFANSLKENLNDEELRHIARLLKCPPDLKDIFTGRIPLSKVEEVTNILMLLRRELPNIVKYLEARSDEKKPDSDLDLGILLHYIATGDKELKDPIPSEMAVEEYFNAHLLGLDFYKILTFDYLVKILNDATVVEVLLVAIGVQDKALFKKAMCCFLNNFHKVIRSEKFQRLKRTRSCAEILIKETTRIWLYNNYVPIPGWPKPEPPTTKPAPSFTEL